MVKIGVCGFGTVGQSFVEHILSYHEKISKNSGKDFVISIIADRSIDKKKFKSSNISFTSNIMDVIDSDCDLIVELVGGTEISYELVKAAILNKKSVITANKALIAEHGDELFRLSRENQIFIGYEAAVAAPPAPWPYNSEVPNLSPFIFTAFITPSILERIFLLLINAG